MSWKPQPASEHIENILETKKIPESDRDEVRRFSEILRAKKPQDITPDMKHWLSGEDEKPETKNYIPGAIQISILISLFSKPKRYSDIEKDLEVTLEGSNTIGKNRNYGSSQMEPFLARMIKSGLINKDQSSKLWSITSLGREILLKKKYKKIKSRIYNPSKRQLNQFIKENMDDTHVQDSLKYNLQRLLAVPTIVRLTPFGERLLKALK